MTPPDSAQSLLLEIARCQNVHLCKTSSGPHPCRAIVDFQYGSLDEFHLPEPWDGPLESAPILFISSNPSLGGSEEYPHWTWPDEHVVDFFENRFGGGRKAWVVGGRSLQVDGSRPVRSTHYWSAIQRRAEELVGPACRPGIDYAVTEIVRCKSWNEKGVGSATDECVRRFLDPTIAASGADVLVLVGLRANSAFRRHFDLPADSLLAEVEIGGKLRMVVSVGHPGSAKPQRIERCVGADGLEKLRRFLAGRRRAPVSIESGPA